MPQLYLGKPPEEGDPVQYLGAYVLKWKSGFCTSYPEMAFTEITPVVLYCDTDENVDAEHISLHSSVEKAQERAYQWFHENYPDEWPQKFEDIDAWKEQTLIGVHIVILEQDLED